MTELERVELMASGSPTWDLSEKDIAALRALLARLRAAEAERDEARAALVKMEEEYRAAVEALETYESRIGDIADHVLGLVPPNVPSVVKLDAIERRCGKERVAARQAEARVRELEATLAECAHEVTCAETLEQARAGVHRAAGDVTGIEEQSAPGR